MLSRRIPELGRPNAWSRALAESRAAGRPLADLTVSDAVRAGLGGLDDAGRAALASAPVLAHEPDPRGAPRARAAIAAELAGEGAAVDPADLVLTASTSESYAHLFRALCDPGDVVLAPCPGYPLFEPLARLEGVRLDHWRLAWDGRWHLDEGALDAAFAAHHGRVRALLVVQPNPPGGSCLDAAEREAVVARCAEHGCVLVSDEVFRPFPRPGRGPLAGFLGESRVPTVVLDGLSKRCGMPQLKLAWMALSGPEAARAELAGALEWCADLFLSVGTPVQAALPSLLAAGPAYRARLAVRLAENLGALERFAAAHPEIDVLPADGGWHAVVRLPARHASEAWALVLLARGVIVHPGNFYDLEGVSAVVVSLLPSPATFAGGLPAIADALAAG